MALLKKPKKKLLSHKTNVKTSTDIKTKSPAKSLKRDGQDRKSSVSSATAKGFSTARKIQKENARRGEIRKNQPLRFYLKAGDRANVILLDKEPEFLYEHNWKGPKGYWDQYEICIQDEGHCPLCSKLGQEGAYIMMLSAVVLKKFTDRKGAEHKFSRMLIPVKTQMMPKYERLYKNNGNSFRGIALKIIRDGDKDARTGNDIEFVKKLSEKDLAKYGDAAKVVDYKKAFPRMTEDEMRKVYETGTITGSDDISGNDEDIEF